MQKSADFINHTMSHTCTHIKSVIKTETI